VGSSGLEVSNSGTSEGGLSAGSHGVGGGGTAAGSGTGAGSTALGGGGGTSGSAGGPSSSSATGLAPGVTSQYIYVGASNPTQSGTVASGVGASGISKGNEQQDWDISAAYVNAHGGIDGRQMKMEYWTYNEYTTENDTAAQQDQAECAAFTQDSHVFAVGDNLDAGGMQCMLSNGVSAVVGAYTTGDDNALLQQYPGNVLVDSITLDRAATAEIPALKKMGYFSPWNVATGSPGGTGTKIGILTWDYPTFVQTVDGALVPALRAAGYSPAVQPVFIYYPNPVSDLGQSAAAISNAVLKFRAAGIDHVLIVDGDGTLTLLFLNDANTQHYYPRYGGTTQDGYEALYSPGDIPASELRGTDAIGWFPSIDINPAQNPDNGPYSNSTRRQCVQMYAAAGVTYSDANAESDGLAICSEALFLQKTLDMAGSDPTRASWLAAVYRMGTSYVDPLTFGTQFASNLVHSGGAEVRWWQWSTTCTCMQYTSAPYNING
jgi:hypothetical protein